jgi:hypothetical protein
VPLSNAHHGGRREPADLASRIEAELRSRIEDAVDMACLDAMVKARQAAGAPPPAVDSPRDREEYTARVRALLERLGAELTRALTPEQRRRLQPAAPGAGGSAEERAMALQVALARALPDYWQRFDDLRQRHAAEPSGREGRRLVDRLLGRD